MSLSRCITDLIIHVTHEKKENTMIKNATALLTATLLLGYIAVMDRATSRNRRSDRGDVLQFVILAAGVCVLAIGVIAWVGPVVQRYLSKIV